MKHPFLTCQKIQKNLKKDSIKSARKLPKTETNLKNLFTMTNISWGTQNRFKGTRFHIK